MGMIITIPGPLTTVQDLGRAGHLAEGFCPSGVMDVPAAVLANALVGNEANAAMLEMTMFGLTATFTSDTVFALTGADMGACLNDAPLIRYTAVAARQGDMLACAVAKTGCRAYLAVSGGIDVPLVMGSRATHLKCRLGGFQGRALRSGDELSFGVPQRVPIPGRSAPIPPELGEVIAVRVTKGPQFDAFDKKERAIFLREAYTVSPQSDRMGMRLEGLALRSKSGTDIISDGIPPGAVQIPESGKPIILLADRQTVGGYTKPWVVITADLPKLAQARPGTKLRFSFVSPARAGRIFRQEQRMRDDMVAAIYN
jgi:biotin-dependent carboxylase-like uncharacterized protein